MPAIIRGIMNGLARVVALAGLFALLLTIAGQFLGVWLWPFELASHFTPYYWVALVLATPLLLVRYRRRARPANPPAANPPAANPPAANPPAEPGATLERVRRCWRLLGLGCALGLVGNSVLLWPLFAPRAMTPTGAPPLRVMTLNLLTANTRYQEVLRYIERENPDVLALLEVNDRWVQALAPLEARYATAYTAPRSDNFGIALYSRQPCQQIETLWLGEAQLASIAAQVPFAGKSLTLLATHPLPPIKQGARLRNDQLAAIAEWAQQQQGPTLVMGDLNTTCWSPYFRRMLRDSRLRDSARGFGWQPTWRPRPTLPGIPIDHVLVSPEIEVLDHWVGPDVGSDHRAVVVEIAPAQE